MLISKYGKVLLLISLNDDVFVLNSKYGNMSVMISLCDIVSD